LRCHSVQPEISSCIRLSNLYTAYILPLFATLCDLDMLEELQRLQVQIGVLKTRLARLESENSSLREEQDSSIVQHQQQIEQKNSVVAQNRQENGQRAEQQTDARDQFQLHNNYATALADRYCRLERSCPDRKDRLQEILAERNELRALKEKVLIEQREAQ